LIWNEAASASSSSRFQEDHSAEVLVRKRPRVWIADGHNLIFRVPRLERLQTEGRRREARRGLEDLLREFAGRTDEKVIVVYDGNLIDANPDGVREDLLETIYSFPPEEADDRIVFLARQRLSDGFRVQVITSDVRTLGASLPPDVPRMTWEDFRRRHLVSAQEAPEKVVVGDFSDVEAEILRRAAEPPAAEPEMEPITPPAPPLPPSPHPRGPVETPSPPAPRSPGAGYPPREEAAREARRLKKERGRRKQARRLEALRRRRR
jgi:hypothetical protein